MKRCATLTLTFLLFITLGACGYQSESSSVAEAPVSAESASSDPQPEPSQPKNTSEPPVESKSSESESVMKNISITVGESVFFATLYDNDAANALLGLFPLMLNMSDLNGNEKYCYLNSSLPTDSKGIGNIHAGDIMLYGSDCLVLFYESFSTSYSYTRLGFIENASELADALGSGSVQVVLAIENRSIASNSQ